MSKFQEMRTVLSHEGYLIEALKGGVKGTQPFYLLQFQRLGRKGDAALGRWGPGFLLGLRR
jgi:hypothetical protein